MQDQTSLRCQLLQACNSFANCTIEEAAHLSYLRACIPDWHLIPTLNRL
jgi:hypothetical protein